MYHNKHTIYIEMLIIIDLNSHTALSKVTSEILVSILKGYFWSPFFFIIFADFAEKFKFLPFWNSHFMAFWVMESFLLPSYLSTPHLYHPLLSSPGNQKPGSHSRLLLLISPSNCPPTSVVPMCWRSIKSSLPLDFHCHGSGLYPFWLHDHYAIFIDFIDSTLGLLGSSPTMLLERA